jgi:uncharacterized protein YdcH (DUF465 family)
MFYRKATCMQRKGYSESTTLKGAKVTVIKSSIFHVLENFPEHAGDIKRLYRQNQKFQTVCEDYRLCAEALHHWNQSNERNAPVRRQEYKQLFQELMDEICLYLNESV